MRKGWVYRWFSDYAVLGDDNLIVTPLKAVAHEYLLILREIGVEVGLAKSLIAKNRLVIEFAKKFFVNGQAANMLPIKECIATWTSSALLSEFVRKYELTLTQTLGFLGRGYKSKG